MASKITQRGKNSYIFFVDIPRDPDNPGKRVRKLITVRGSFKDAERRQRQIQYAIDRGEYSEPTKLTFAEYSREWLSGYAQPNCSPRTAEGYRMITECHLIPALGSLPLTSITPKHVRDYIIRCRESGRRDGQGGLSNRTIHHHYRLLYEIMEHATADRMVPRNVVEDVKPPRPEYREMMALSPEELTTLIEAMHETPYYALFMTFALTGFRRSEVLGLRWRDVDLNGGTISVVRSLHQLWGGEIVNSSPKTKTGRRQVAMGHQHQMILKTYKEQRESNCEFLGCKLKADNLVFSRPDGSPIRPGFVSKEFKRIIRSIGLSENVSLHTLRHTHATIMLSQGANVKEVSERLGHHSAAFTLDVYGHSVPGRQKVVANKFEELLQKTSGWHQ